MRRLLLVLCLLSCGTSSMAEESLVDPLLLTFSARGLDGETVEVTRSTETRFSVVCFLGVECPVARLYAPRLQDLADEFAERGVQFVGVSSNRQDSIEKLTGFVESFNLRFPIVKDHQNLIADRYGAKRTPEVFVLDNQLRIRYRGRIDDEFQPGVSRLGTTRHDLKQAISELLAGQPVTIPATDAVGCLIGRVSKGEVTTKITYARDVSRILRRHCVECHQPGEIGPFSLTDYDDVIGWGPMLVETIDDGRMPPWHADPAHGEFRNARFMSERDKNQLREWVSGGMPFGDAEQLPEPLTRSDELWQLGDKLDLIVPMGNRPFQIPADELVEYQYYVVDPGFEEETWVTGAQVFPGNRSVVHHCIVFIRPPDGFDTRGIGWLTAYVPGQRAMPFPEGYARRVPAGSRLVFQMHYTPTGTPEEDLTQIGLRFGREEEITHEVFTLTAINHDFEIPPHAENFAVRASRGRLPKNGELLAAAPHMHVRGKSFELFAQREGNSRKLLSIPKYDFNWQHVYAFQNPIPLSEIDSLLIEARFNNSKSNPANPDPTAFVTWGDQTFEEMAIGFFEVAVPRGAPSKKYSRQKSSVSSGKSPANRAAEQFADEYFRRFDRNGDGVILRDELPDSIGRFGFRALDLNSDQQLTRDEIISAFERRRN